MKIDLSKKICSACGIQSTIRDVHCIECGTLLGVISPVKLIIAVNKQTRRYIFEAEWGDGTTDKQEVDVNEFDETSDGKIKEISAFLCVDPKILKMGFIHMLDDFSIGLPPTVIIGL